jgi:hypothetical protein
MEYVQFRSEKFGVFVAVRGSFDIDPSSGDPVTAGLSTIAGILHGHGATAGGVGFLYKNNTISFGATVAGNFYGVIYTL